ncbi:hypothetical protein TcG_09191 [Trypanosoma cruzi]|nr:hypothetical protein TcG_09191 [Trypanosoma cruzi]
MGTWRREVSRQVSCHECLAWAAPSSHGLLTNVQRVYGFFFCLAPGGCLSLCTGAGVLFGFHFPAGRRLLHGWVRGSIESNDEGGGTGRTPCIDCPAIIPYLDTGALGR